LADDEISPARLNEMVRQLLGPVDGNSHPNHLSALWHVLNSMEAIKLNIKYFGYEMLANAARALPVKSESAPMSIGLGCKPTTQADIESKWLAVWATGLKIPVVYSRKLWEFAYVLQALFEHDMMTPGRRGLGFGCGVEPLPSFLASKGVAITVSDAPPEHQVSTGWAKTAQYAASREQAYYEKLVDRSSFERLVDFCFADMRNIDGGLSNFDFCWSICALEHLGTIAAGMDFVENSLGVLKPGGISVHTTEFNFLHDDYTIDDWVTVLPQRQHFQELSDRLTAKGHWVAPLDFEVGKGPIDRFIDMPPYPFQFPEPQRGILSGNNNHLKLTCDGIPTTCFGLIVKKALN
jgi:SAM-dependent methyltransferase